MAKKKPHKIHVIVNIGPATKHICHLIWTVWRAHAVRVAFMPSKPISDRLEVDRQPGSFPCPFKVHCTETPRNGSAQQFWGWIEQHWKEMPTEQALLPHSSIQMVVPMKRGRKNSD